jgi:hypothetical protein
VTVSPAEAVSRVLALVGRRDPYVLGGGNHLGPTRVRRKDGTLTSAGWDCWAVAGSYAYEQPRHDPGFNKGPWATVSDDRNTDSAVEDAEHKREGYTVADRPELGDLLCYPSIRDKDRKRIRIGHVWIVVGVPAEWDSKAPQYHLLDTVQCQASTRPAIKRGPGPKSDASTYHGIRDEAWRVRILRPTNK